jgi:hypothetical protein
MACCVDLKSIERSWPWFMAGMRQYGKSGPAGTQSGGPGCVRATARRSVNLALSPPRPESPTQWRRVPGLGGIAVAKNFDEVSAVTRAGWKKITG